MIIVFTTLYTAKQGVGRAECTEAIDNDYATGATLHLADPCGRFFVLTSAGLKFEAALRALAKQNLVHICRAERVKLACKPQACISAIGIPGLHLQDVLIKRVQSEFSGKGA